MHPEFSSSPIKDVGGRGLKTGRFLAVGIRKYPEDANTTLASLKSRACPAKLDRTNG
jgi:hypothetical protein